MELYVSDLARESSADPQYRYESTGPREVAERIKLDGSSDLYKGELHYRAEFIPALNLKYEHFDASKNEIQRVAQEAQRGHVNGSSPSSRSSSSIEEEERFVTVTRPTTENGPHQTDSTESVRTNGGGDAKSDKGAPSIVAEGSVKESIELSKEELFKHRELPALYPARIHAHLHIKSRVSSSLT